MIDQLSSVCPSCKEQMLQAAAFCPHCGSSLKVVKKVSRELSTLTPTFLFYFITLLLCGLCQFTEIFDNSFISLIFVDIFSSVLVLIFSLHFYKSFKGLFSFQKLKVKVLFLVIGSAILGAAIVSVLADLINHVLYEDVFYDYSAFYETSYPKLFAIISICVQPAIFEEVAFRGFMYSNIEVHAGAQTTLFITAFLFGIIHLSLVSLIWLFPIGLAFAFLRLKYHTLWYGMVGHFIYNLSIITIDYFNLGLN